MLHESIFSVSIHGNKTRAIINTKGNKTMRLKAIQDALKGLGHKLNQDVIANILKSENIDFARTEDNELDGVVEVIVEKIKTDGQMVVGGKKSKGHLGFHNPVSKDLTLPEESETNAYKRTKENDVFVAKATETVEAISDNHVEMVKAMPYMVQQLTMQKLAQNSQVISDAWAEVNEELSDYMFGL